MAKNNYLSFFYISGSSPEFSRPESGKLAKKIQNGPNSKISTSKELLSYRCSWYATWSRPTVATEAEKQTQFQVTRLVLFFNLTKPSKEPEPLKKKITGDGAAWEKISS